MEARLSWVSVGGGLVHHPVQPQKQLLHQEGLSEVVVGAEFQSLHPVAALVARREEQNGRFNAFKPGRSAHRKPIHAGHHQVQNGGSESLGAQRFQGIRAVFDVHHGVPLAPQIEGQHLAQRSRVLREE